MHSKKGNTMKCRGCGKDTRDYESEVGWMHWLCEIKRLKDALAEAKWIISDLEENQSAIKEKEHSQSSIKQSG